MNGNKGNILWADDEIDHLRSHIIFLREKGYSVTPVTNAEDAISLVKKERYDILLLDEMMPGMDGLEALNKIKIIDPSIPIVMITKSEEEDLMEEAIGGKIEDYLTKPVNPSQILSSCKRILEKRRIARDKITRDYIEEFSEITNLLQGQLDFKKWAEIHLKLSERYLNLDEHNDLGLNQTLEDQRAECNHSFARFIESNYREWINSDKRPVLSTDVMKNYVFPFLKKGEKVLFIVIDNLRLDQWLAIEPMLYDFVKIERNYQCSLIPSATPYSRNSIFSGLFPSQIKKQFPEYWMKNADSEASLNKFEYEFLKFQVNKNHINVKGNPQYLKIITREEANHALIHFKNMVNNQLIAMVFNFIDIISHRRNDSEIIHEIVPDESAYRSLTKTWFKNSSLFEIIKKAAQEKIITVLTTDHGSIRVKRGTTIYADRFASTNLRYKYGRGIRAEGKGFIEINSPEEYGLPVQSLNTNYIIATEDVFFVYPTNYHKYLTLFKNSFQHGGISLEEMILPVITMTAK